MNSNRSISKAEEFDIPVLPKNEGEKLDVDISQFKNDIEKFRTYDTTERSKAINELVEELPEPDEFEFILILTHMVEMNLNNQEVLEDILNRFRNFLEEPVQSIERDETFVEFTGFHGLTIYNYLTQTISKWGDRHLEYGDKFRGWEYENMYRFDRAMQQYFTNETSKIRTAREQLELLATRDLTDNPGVINAYVECTLLACDKKELVVSDHSLKQAAEMICHAIELYSWPEYYRNWGRLLGIYGERTQNEKIIEYGIERIKDGMDKENASNMQKLSGYRQYLNNTQNRKRNIIFESKLHNVQSELEAIREQGDEIARDIRNETLQFLGFFAAIITFIITGVQFSTTLNTISQIAAIIPIMTGCLVFSFSVLIFILEDPINNDSSRFSLVAMWGIGLVLISLGLGIIEFI